MSRAKFLVHEFFSACWETIKLPFWLFGVGWRRLAGFGPRRIGLVLFASSVVVVFSLLLFVKVTSQPTFCKSCHVMIPYFDAWETSSHAMVTCTECHIPPGIEGTVHSKFLAISMVTNYMTGLYKRSKPWAEIDDASCLRSGCHDTRLLQSTENFRGVMFDHRPHLENVRRGRQLRCTSCHANIVQGEHISVNESTCFLCHFKPDSLGAVSKLSTCTHCHNPPVGSVAADTSYDHTEMLARRADCANCHASEVAGDGFVPRERCNTCHAKLEHIERYDDHEFVHQMHVTDHKVECTACHIQIRHGKDAVAQASEERTCGECHGKPDNAVERVWRGELPGIPPSPSSMARAGMECESCHVGEIHAATKEHPEPQCSHCHDAEFDQLWKRWQVSIDQGLRELDARLSSLDAATADTLRKAIDLYKRGNPLHNPELVDVLTSRVTGSPSAAGHACAVCHPGAATAVVAHDGKRFDHSQHARAGECTACHEPERKEQHGRLRMPSDQCNACHHEAVTESKSDCGSCHTTQAAVYAGKAPDFAGAEPSFKVDLEIVCTDCHAVRGNHVSRDVLPACVACHDESIGDSLKSWQTSAQTISRNLQTALAAYRAGSEPHKKLQQLAELLAKDGSKSAHNPELFRRWYESLGVAQ